MENRLAIKGRNAILSTTWTNRQYVRLLERNQPGNSTYWMIPFIGRSKKGKTIRTENRSVVAKSWGRGDVLSLECGGGYMTVCIRPNSQNCILKR